MDGKLVNLSTRVSRLTAGLCSVVIAATALVVSAPAAARPDPGLAAAEAEASSPASAQTRYAQEPMPLIELVSASGVGRLYTTNPAEARRAVSIGMTEERRVVGFMPRSSVDGSRPVYRLKPTATATRWLLSTSSAEISSLVGRGWVNEGVVGYLWTQPSDGLVQLLRFNNGREWRVAPATRRDELVRAGYSVDGGLGYLRERWIRAGAVIFPQWHPGVTSKEDACEREYGRRDIWCGIKDFYAGHPNASTWPDADFSYLKPAIGYYDDSDPRTWEKHITQATSAGLSFFSAYWYWDSQKREERSTDRGLAAFLQASNSQEIDFTVAVCAHTYQPLQIPVEHFPQVAEILVRKYVSQPNTLRTNDRRKILSVCDARGLGSGSNADVAAFVKAVRAEARRQLGEDIYISLSHPALHASRVSAVGGDGAYCTTDGAQRQSYVAYVDGQRSFFAQAPAKQEFIRCAMSGFDERTRYPAHIPNLDSIRYFRDYRREDFRQAARNVRLDIDASTRPRNVDNIAVFFAWNEWNEGGVIEPNVRDGCFFLNVIREELRLTNGSGCVASPNP